MPRVGILVECGREGMEAIVCPRICALLQEATGIEIEPVIVPMVNKQQLVEGCGTVALALLRDGCDRVVILWDERPAWPIMGEPLCWHRERIRILEELRQVQLENREVHLVCIEREFESWLLYDHTLLSRLVSTKEHRVRVKRQKNPHRMANPKGVMKSLVERYRGRYVDIVEAPRIARELDSLGYLKKCATFRRFALKVTGATLK